MASMDMAAQRRSTRRAMVLVVGLLSVALVLIAAPTASAANSGRFGDSVGLPSARAAAPGHGTSWSISLAGDDVAYRAAAEAWGRGRSLSVAAPSQVRTGDVLLLMVAVNQRSDDRSVSVPPGWIALGTQNDERMHSRLWWRVATADSAGTTTHLTLNRRAKVNAHLVAYREVTGAPRAMSRSNDTWGADHPAPPVSGASSTWVVSWWADKNSVAGAWTVPESLFTRTALAEDSSPWALSSVVADTGGRVDGPDTTMPERAWRDDFDRLDPSVWRVVDWGCFSSDNVDVSGGLLRVSIRPDDEATGCDGVTGARVNTLFRRDWPSGTFSARIKFDVAPGSWQTFWLTGANGTWPANGEVDIAEITGKTPMLAHHRLHSSRVDAPWKRCTQGADPALRPDGKWRTYSVTVAPDRVVFSTDGEVIGDYRPIPECTWPYGDRMRIIFGARGGRYGGDVDVRAYPVTYLVDWVSWEPLE